MLRRKASHCHTLGRGLVPACLSGVTPASVPALQGKVLDREAGEAPHLLKPTSCRLGKHRQEAGVAVAVRRLTEQQSAAELWCRAAWWWASWRPQGGARAARTQRGGAWSATPRRWAELRGCCRPPRCSWAAQTSAATSAVSMWCDDYAARDSAHACIGSHRCAQPYFAIFGGECACNMQRVHSEHRQAACERGEVHLSIPVCSQEEGSREAFVAVDHSVQR